VLAQELRVTINEGLEELHRVIEEAAVGRESLNVCSSWENKVRPNASTRHPARLELGKGFRD
jgi:hypothetical protein